MDLTYWEKQLVLYTKMHFGKINYKHHLKYFTAKNHQVSDSDVSLVNMFSMVSSTYKKLVMVNHSEFDIQNFILDVFKNAAHSGNHGRADMWDVMETMLSEIQNSQPKALGLDLGVLDNEFAKTLS